MNTNCLPEYKLWYKKVTWIFFYFADLSAYKFWEYMLVFHCKTLDKILLRLSIQENFGKVPCFGGLLTEPKASWNKVNWRSELVSGLGKTPCFNLVFGNQFAIFNMLFKERLANRPRDIWRVYLRKKQLVFMLSNDRCLWFFLMQISLISEVYFKSLTSERLV